MSMGVELLRVFNNDGTVHAYLRGGRSLAETVVALSDEKARLVEMLRGLELIAPRKMTIDGVVRVWHCPDELVPDRKESPTMNLAGNPRACRSQEIGCRNRQREHPSVNQKDHAV